MSNSGTRRSTRLFLEDWVADMIDGEVYRQGHKKEFEKEWMEKNRPAVVKSMNTVTDSSNNNLMLNEDQLELMREKNKDRTMAVRDPQRYCADRCISTGNCDVYEDL